MKKHRLWGQAVILTSMALMLFACARGKDFTIAEHEQAPQSGQYPEFRKPIAAINQFADEDITRLSNLLDADKHVAAQSVFLTPAKAVENTEKMDEIRRETESVLRQIEQSGAPKAEQDNAADKQ